ncbi:hypothetical protein [Actinomyces ruminis]|nr:hypothetical protein [Actinomyces ruminis]
MAYAPAYFLVISALARTDNPLPMPTTIRDSRGQYLDEAPNHFRGHL